MLPGETVDVLTPGVATDPFSDEPIDDWDNQTSIPVANVLVDRQIPDLLLDVRDAVTTRLRLYFQGDPGVTVTARNRVRVRGVTYDVFGEPGDYRMGRRFGLVVDAVDILSARRATAEVLMVDTCRVDRQTGSDPADDGTETTTYTTIYEGKCRVRVRGAGNQLLRSVGDQQVSLAVIEVEVPVVGSEGIQVRDRVTILRATYDADLLNREFRVSQATPETDAPLRLVQCVEVTA